MIFPARNPMNCFPFDCGEETRKKCNELYWGHVEILKGIVDNLVQNRISDPEAIERACKIADSYVKGDWMREDYCLLHKMWGIKDAVD